MSLPRTTNHPDYTKGRWRCWATRSRPYRSGVRPTPPTSCPSLDSNGEPRYDDVMSFIKRKNYFAGNFMADEVKDINNTLTSLGVDNINDLNDMIVSNFLSGGDIFLNRYNLERSGMYDADEIDNIMTNRSEYERVRDMMRRIVDFMSEGNLNEKDMYFLSSESGLGDDYMIYEDTYDSLGKRRGLNPIEVRDTIMRAVGGISDRREFDQAFASIPYPSLALRYQEDQDYADRMYDTYRNMTRMEVRSQDGNTITDSYFNSTTPYISMPKDMKGLRDKVGEIIDMDDFKDIKDVAGRLHDIAMDLADISVILWRRWMSCCLPYRPAIRYTIALSPILIG